ncbi:MAG: COR domain-containing protein, partial [Planctomycetota bacterium]
MVCSNTVDPDEDLRERLQGEIPDSYRDSVQTFFVDSLTKQGDLIDLMQEIEEQVEQLVAKEGNVVPSYWSLAQDMVDEWLRQITAKPPSASQLRQMTSDAFFDHLVKFVETYCRDHPQDYPQLSDAISKGEFVLKPEDRISLLRFLNDSGWLFWKPNLIEERVIVDQQWALDAIYTILDRRKDAEIFRTLNRSDGRFTRSKLEQWGWNQEKYSKSQQSLLISAMELCGLCFPLVQKEDSWREETVYCSFAHLPSAKEIRLRRDYDHANRSTNEDRYTFPLSRVHRLIWNRVLVAIGAEYGIDAKYAVDAVFFVVQTGDAVYISSDYNRS